jgi:hypothetical protein
MSLNSLGVHDRDCGFRERVQEDDLKNQCHNACYEVQVGDDVTNGQDAEPLGHLLINDRRWNGSFPAIAVHILRQTADRDKVPIEIEEWNEAKSNSLTGSGLWVAILDQFPVTVE